MPESREERGRGCDLTPAPLVSMSCLFLHPCHHLLKALAVVVLSNYWFRVHDRKWPAGARGSREGGCGAAGREALLACCLEDQKRDPGSAERHQGQVGGDGHLHDPLSQVGWPGTYQAFICRSAARPAMPTTVLAWGSLPKRQLSVQGWLEQDALLGCPPACLPLSNNRA